MPFVLECVCFLQYDSTPSIEEKFTEVEQEFGLAENLDLVRGCCYGL
jgi:hypothetical protein